MAGTQTLHEVLVWAHVVTGVTGLLLAGPVLLAPKRRGLHTAAGRAYAGAVVVVVATALALTVFDPARAWPLALLAVATGGWLGRGLWYAVRRPRPDWMTFHLQHMGSSVIAMVTAFLVQVADGHLLAWIAPSVVGSFLITRRKRAAGRAAATGPSIRTAAPQPSSRGME